MADRILFDVLWRFGPPVASRQALSDAVRRYQEDVRGQDTWTPDELLIAAQRIDVWFESDDAEDGVSRLQLHSADAHGFTALDLLYQLHQELTGVDLGDHVFFEGLVPDGKDRYELRLGS